MTAKSAGSSSWASWRYLRASRTKPALRLRSAMPLASVEEVVGPAELEHDGEVGRIVFLGKLEVLEGIADEAGLEAALGHDFGVDGGRGRLGRARVQGLGQAQDGAHAVGEIIVGAFHDAFE